MTEGENDFTEEELRRLEPQPVDNPSDLNAFRDRSSVVSFTKSRLPNGWMGNMSPFPVSYRGKEWRTAEALFQALRFDDAGVREQIRAEKSPMGAKFVAKREAAKMVVEPTSHQDLSNMELVLRLKLEQNPLLKLQLLQTGESDIVEDVTSRQHGRNLFWGAAFDGSSWTGGNALGNMWVKLREELRAVGHADMWKTYVSSESSITCLFCGMVSTHPDDVSQKYCGSCHRFH